MSKYAEEVYGRAEFQFKDVKAQISWLASFDDKTGKYAEEAVGVANELQNSLDIVNQADDAINLKELRSLTTKANKLDYGKDEPLGKINDRIRILEGEADEYKEIIKTSRSFSDIDKAIESLREISPQKLGGIKSGQVRFRGSKKEQKQIGEALGFLFEEE